MWHPTVGGIALRRPAVVGVTNANGRSRRKRREDISENGMDSESYRGRDDLSICSVMAVINVLLCPRGAWAPRSCFHKDSCCLFSGQGAFGDFPAIAWYAGLAEAIVGTDPQGADRP